jgi:hypothetical protein
MDEEFIACAIIIVLLVETCCSWNSASFLLVSQNANSYRSTKSRITMEDHKCRSRTGFPD